MADWLQKKEKIAYPLAFLLISLLFCTWLRLGILLTYPLIVLFLFFACQWKLSRNGLYILLLVAVCWLLSLRNGWYLRYNLVSFYFYIPFLLLLFAQPAQARRDFLPMFMLPLALVVIINDLVGFAQYIITPNDDSFRGIYGAFTVSQNGLSIVNAVLFFYYFTLFQHRRRAVHLLLMIFFLISSVMGFYGAGLIVLIVALVLTFSSMNAGSFLKVLAIATVLCGVLVLTMSIVAPKTLEYNVAVIRLFLHPGSPYAPRKLTIFSNYLRNYPREPVNLIFGSGPGTFNSRSAFMVGSPSYFSLEMIKSANQPYYFKNFAYTLWNSSNAGPYDGFMNQPFSSLLSLLGEYGSLTTVLIALVHLGRYISLNRIIKSIPAVSGAQPTAVFYRFCFAYTVMLMVIDNYIEYPEVIALLLIIIKMSRQTLQQAYMLRNDR